MGQPIMKSTLVHKLHSVTLSLFSFYFLIIFCLKFLALYSLSLDFYVFVTVIFLFLLPVVGELKKLLSGPTGLHHQDQKLFYKDKERDSNAFLDITGVKDKSKLVLMEDPISQEKRYLEMRKNAKMEKAAKSVSEISLEVDRLAGRVCSCLFVSFN